LGRKAGVFARSGARGADDRPGPLRVARKAKRPDASDEYQLAAEIGSEGEITEFE
jgi:hypothetical protein